MPTISFEWDEKKNTSNKKKHGVSFEEGQTVFVDENALLIDDPDHSDDEERYIMLGISVRLRVLVVCHSYRKNEASIRIISARKATRFEQKQYWERWSK
ncbi:MAG: BrnT family toxin [Nitrospira sp.]|nr:BrnT family toxin [Nitrospira sp.]